MCHRDFTLGRYSEYHSGLPEQRILRLRQFPVIAISRLATAAPALLVTNAGVTAQRATVATTAGGLVLASICSGTPAIAVLLYATYPTLVALATAISRLGGGWSASTLSGAFGPFAAWPAADLKPIQGALTAMAGGATLEIYEDFQGGAWPGNSIDSTWANISAGWQLDDQTGELFGFWPRGRLNIRVDYTAGFASVPDAVQQACVQLAADLLGQSQLNGAVASARLGSAGYTLNASAASLARSPRVFGLIRAVYRV